MDISVVILTYNRPDILRRNLGMLDPLRPLLKEIIVIDNSSDQVSGDMIEKEFPQVDYIKNSVNTGVAGRNRGLARAQGEVILTLDDDVVGISGDDLVLMDRLFREKDSLGALCFRVLHFETGEICNWCHHRKAEEAGHSHFLTYEISEGAVAYRREALEKSGYYFEKFFISHEGKDLAFRLMNNGYLVEYEGGIHVNHWHAESGRPDWRRYYYDTRNSIWLAVRNMPVWYGMRFLFVALASMGVYGVRDGFVTQWARAIRDGLRAIPEIRKDRVPWSPETKRLVREIDDQRPGFFYMVSKRAFRRKVEI